jgi:hypothetical protein
MLIAAEEFTVRRQSGSRLGSRRSPPQYTALAIDIGLIMQA